MADPADLAQAHVDAFLAGAIAAVHQPAGRGPDMSDGTPRCRECGEEILARRLAARPDAELCVVCQGEAESVR